MDITADSPARVASRAWRLKASVRAPLGAIGVLCLSGSGHAFELTQDSDLKLRWDNTFKYSTVVRVKNPSAGVLNGQPGVPPPGPELDDGDRNFKKGMVSNRIDILSELDGAYKQWGFRVTGAGWYDTVYNRGNDNTSSTVNSISVPAGQFTAATRNEMGRKAELLDAFVYMKSDADSESPWIVRAGKHTVLYGESLFFGANGTRTVTTRSTALVLKL